MTSPQQDDELRKIVEDSVRHARANVGYTINSHDARERNISMNVETIMVAARLYAHKMVVDELKAIARNTNITNRAGYIADRIVAIEKEGKS